MDQKSKHLEFIQGVINRLSQNSFLLKGWSMVLISSLLAFSASNTTPAFVFLACIPAIIFWGLDGYFLWEEKKFRALYDHVRNLDENEINFSMDTSVVKDKVTGWVEVIFSKTLVPFHGVLIGAIIVVMCLTFYR